MAIISNTKMGVQFLKAIARLEERTPEGKKKIAEDQKFLDQVILDARKQLDEIFRYRVAIIHLADTGRITPPLPAIAESGNRIMGHSPADCQIALREACKKDITFWINTFCYTFIPALTKYKFPPRIPFILFPKQVEYLRWREERYNRNEAGVVFKCREMGVSWLNAASQTWHWLFEPGFQGRFGSNKLDQVDDKNNPDSLFWKIRYLIYSQPSWMIPPEFHSQKNEWDNKQNIRNPQNQAVIAGEGGDNMGTGGRAGMYDVDEWAKVEHDKSVDASISGNCAVRFYTSTPYGMDNDFAAKITSGMLPIFSFDWWDDPRKTEDWFKNYEETHDPAITAQEVLKRLDAFNAGTAIPMDWVSASVDLWNKIEHREIDYMPAGGRSGGLDVAAGGRARSVLVWRDGIVVKDCYEWNIKLTTELGQKAGSACEENKVEVLGYDPIAVGVGIKDYFNRTEHTFTAIPVDYRGAASDGPLEGDTRPAHDRCLNRRAELAMIVRKRFERTYEYIARKVEHPLETLIAVPNNPKLRAHLSTPELFSQNGKWRLEPKEAMAKRGVESPDYFDATLICFANEGDKRVLPAFSRIDSTTPINMHLPFNRSIQRYVSIHHAESGAAGAILAMWYHETGRLAVASEAHSIYTSAQAMAAQIKAFGPDVHEYVGNKHMFTTSGDDLFMQYLDQGIVAVENVTYNELASIGLLNQMIENGKVTISQGCKKLMNQLEEFLKAKGRPQMDNMELALALCGLVNRLQEFSLPQEKTLKMSGYHRGRP
jgi:phage terminase large subunit